MSSSSQDPISTGRPGALLCSTNNRLNAETCSVREDFSLRHQQALGNNEPLFRFSNSETSVNSILEGHRDRMLAEAKYEIMKQECKVDPLNTCTRDLNDKLILSGWNWMMQTVGMKSRREQVRLEELLALREKSTSKDSYQKHP